MIPLRDVSDPEGQASHVGVSEVFVMVDSISRSLPHSIAHLEQTVSNLHESSA